MKRREIPGGIRFLTFSCEHRLPLLGNREIRNLFVLRLNEMRTRFHIDLFAWVVMPEHVHLIVRPSHELALSPALSFLKKSVAMRVIDRWRTTRPPVLRRLTRPDGAIRFWLRGGGFDRNVRDLDEFTREVRYVHRNPVERNLVAAPEDWDWSSARWWMGHSAPLIRCDPVPWIAPEHRRSFV